jgi:transcription elongation GreA/GreB family factor
MSEACPPNDVLSRVGAGPSDGSTPGEEDLWGVPEAATRLGISSQCLRQLIARGDVALADTRRGAKMIREGELLRFEGELARRRTSNPSAQVGIGSTVVIRDGQRREAWQIVDPSEADSKLGRIAADSPVGRALLGQRVGDVVTVERPGRRGLVLVLVIA